MISNPLIRLSIVAAGVLSAGALFTFAPAQDDPFAQEGTGQAEPDNPFAGESADSPFQPSFGEGEADQPPFGETGSEDSPFGGDTGATDQQQGESPFEMSAGQEPADPFAGADAGAQDGQASPFDIGPDAGADASPFGPASPAQPEAEVTGGTGATGTSRISQLYEFRYTKRELPDGTELVVRKLMTKEEAESWDEQVKQYYLDLAEDDELSNFDPSVNNADDWAEWLLYSVQAELWLEFCNRVVLVGNESTWEPEDIPWPGAPDVDEEEQEEDLREEAPADIRNENRSLDDQLADFSPVPDTRQGNQGAQVIDPAIMDANMVTIYQDLLATLRDYEEEQVAFMRQLNNDLLTREREREAYQDWRETQKEELLAYLDEWIRGYEGKVVTIAGVRYELYKPGEVPPSTRRGANIVETEFGLTPHDLLNQDGTLRGPAR